MILRISSQNIKSPNSLLDDDNGKYMYTTENFPLEIVIALKEEVSIEKIMIKSKEVYSSIIKKFIIFGAFALDHSHKGHDNWFKLVEATAKNEAGEQTFRTVNKVIRFLKMQVLSAHGEWQYFTMTQIRVHGNSLYADAMHNFHEKTNNIDLEPEVDTASMHLFEDLQKMITLSREGNKTIPQNNLIQYFFEELQKLAKLEEKQILYMNNLTIKIQHLQTQINSLSRQRLAAAKAGSQDEELKVSSIYSHFKPYTLPEGSPKKRKE